MSNNTHHELINQHLGKSLEPIVYSHQQEARRQALNNANIKSMQKSDRCFAFKNHRFL